MLWGGLHPIRSRLYLDLASLLLTGFAIYIQSTELVPILLLTACVITFATSGLTKRWTISFPLIAISLLQMIGLLSINDGNYDKHFWRWIGLFFIKIFSSLLLVLSAILTVSFPAVEISHPKGKYNVGLVDIHLPVEFDHEAVKLHQLDTKTITNEKESANKSGYVSVRLLYPTLDPVQSLPYFNIDTAKDVCEALMKVGAPPPLNRLNWMLDTWQLSRIQARRNARLIPQHQTKTTNKEKDSENCNTLPAVVFSHGLTGIASLYSYQCISLASSGKLVFMVNHTDGSAIGMKRHDGVYVHYALSVGALERENLVEYVRARRKQADHRSAELLAVTKAIVKLNAKNIPELEEIGISFQKRIQNIAVGGHSFGGATAVTTATRNPELFSCVFAHDPALDWMPDDARKSMFDKDRFIGSHSRYSGGTGGYENIITSVKNDEDEDDDDDGEKEKKEDNGSETKNTLNKMLHNSSSIHDIDLFFLYSHEWKKKGWGGITYINDLLIRGQLGPKVKNKSVCGFVHNANHSEFSDSCMKTPLWLARATGMTGCRNPHETSEEIADRTLDFFHQVEYKKKEY